MLVLLKTTLMGGPYTLGDLLMSLTYLLFLLACCIGGMAWLDSFYE
jgi:hypothetical protein